MNKTRLMTIGLAVIAAGIALPRIQAYAAKNPGGILGKLFSA